MRAWPLFRSCYNSMVSPPATAEACNRPPAAFVLAVAQCGALDQLSDGSPMPAAFTLSAMNDVSFQSDLARDVARRRTFAIISHPDAGKTTLTEKLLLFGGAIQLAGTVKSRKSARHATSDWMEVEKQPGIPVTSSVMPFEFAGHADNR